MIIPPAPQGHAAESADACSDGPCRAARNATARVPFRRTLQSDHAKAFRANAVRVPIDSADFAARAWAGAPMRRMHVCAGRPAAPARG
jgi:hypothetical protein